jgi:hypothetical protein
MRSRVFAVSGYNGANVAFVEELHVGDKSWTTKASSLTQGRHHARAVYVPASAWWM